MSHWSDEDLRQMRTRSIDPSEADCQLSLFKDPPPFIHLERPAVIGDGILSLDLTQRQSALEHFERSRAQGRLMKFVPASGAATRMFQFLIKYSQGAVSLDRMADGEGDRVREFMDDLPRRGFFPELQDHFQQKGMDVRSLLVDRRYQEILKVLLNPDGMNYAQRPKGLIPFHLYPGETRSPVTEHLIDSTYFLKDDKGLCRIHFTVSEDFRDEFRLQVDRSRAMYGEKYSSQWQVDYSVQKPSTDTLAVDFQNKPFRDTNGQLVFRPGGHGALLENLNELGGDLVYITNIDNVAVESWLERIVPWRKILIGHLAKVQERVFHFLRVLNVEKVVSADIKNFIIQELRLPLGSNELESPTAQRLLIDLLNRPIRVCGMVKNTGGPGGGPFWVKDPKGKLTLQIVEQSQVDPHSSEQLDILRKATHFNPVDLVCGVRDWKGNPFDLKDFVDGNAVFFSQKSMLGRDLKAIELPGLWNGAMADWITLFVEVPLETFNPVKTVFDLMKPAHCL